jgi:hypothetical protein
MARRAIFSFSLLVAGCFPSGEGVDPPPDRSVYFPVGLALDSGNDFLFIANSDFDLQYNAGTVSSWNLNTLNLLLPKACTTNADCVDDGDVCDATTADVTPNDPPSGWCVRGEPDGDGDGKPDAGSPCRYSGALSAADRQIYPGRCGALDPRGAHFLADSVEIGSFATDIVYRARPPVSERGGVEEGEPGRLFIPVRGDATLHWIDVDAAGNLLCDEQDGACGGTHRRGNNPTEENTRGAAMLPEPFGIDLNETGTWALVSNQASFAAGLFKNVWGTGNGIANGPLYQYTYPFQLSAQPMGVSAVPRPRAIPAADDLPEFLVSFHGAAVLEVLRVYPDAASEPPRPYAKAPVGQPILTNSNGTDSRGMAVDGSARRKQEEICVERFGVAGECATDLGACDPEAPSYEDYKDCLREAAAIPLDVLVTNRAPSTLLVGETRNVIASVGAYDVPAFQATVPVGFSPSRVVAGDITNVRGELERRAFVISFDSRRVLVYDMERQRIETEIVTGRGPQAIAIDSTRSLAYVAHFTDSYIGIVDLDQRHPLTYGVMIASAEQPAAPRASK